ncbi:hypothetical protein [Luteimonas fraxinea]|nr:hypothetical protein [Luteimonas fraxinea]MCD9125854.1 hypothetical protein [Luteimonas fraxinea]
MFSDIFDRTAKSRTAGIGWIVGTYSVIGLIVWHRWDAVVAWWSAGSSVL